MTGVCLIFRLIYYVTIKLNNQYDSHDGVYAVEFFVADLLPITSFLSILFFSRQHLQSSGGERTPSNGNSAHRHSEQPSLNASEWIKTLTSKSEPDDPELAAALGSQHTEMQKIPEEDPREGSNSAKGGVAATSEETTLDV